MLERTAPSTTSERSTSFIRRAAWIAIAGLVGLLSLLLLPVPASLLEKVPELAALPPFAQRAVLLLNPLVLLVVAALIGAALAHRVGLRSLLAGTANARDFARNLGLSAALGLALGLLLAAIDSAFSPYLGSQWQSIVANAPYGFTTLITGLLYGAITEEVLLRWGVMSLVAWAFIKILGQHRDQTTLIIAVLISSVVFGLAHLPALAMQIELTPLLIARTLLLNALAGLLYGWLFMRHHLESAMIAHAATHLGLAVWRFF